MNETREQLSNSLWESETLQIILEYHQAILEPPQVRSPGK